jgi:hypothetical protein
MPSKWLVVLLAVATYAGVPSTLVTLLASWLWLTATGLH